MKVKQLIEKLSKFDPEMDVLGEFDSDGDDFFVKVDLKKVYKGNIQIVKNRFNYGGHGSLIRNIDKIETPWFCTFHQDDFYKPNHVSTIANLITNSKKNIVGVSTTMGSITNTGKILNSKPRVNWFSPNLDQPGQFWYRE